MITKNLSICILTHNRPHLFQQCLDSVLRVAPGAEILVNNDSRDITPDHRAVYFFEQGPLNALYQYLAGHATGTHIWFMEDDDTALQAPVMSEAMTAHRYFSSDKEIINPDPQGPEFQLSQCCIPKHLLDFTKIEWDCNCIFNDYHLVKGLPYMAVPRIIFRQGFNDDNISFYESKNYRGKEACKTCPWLPSSMRQEVLTRT